MLGSQPTSVRSQFCRVALCAAVVLAGVSFGQSTTTSSVVIGGPGALGCTTPPSDPPTLEENVAAGGTCDYAFNPVTQILTLTVANTSPIVTGVANPVITKIFVNMPALAVSGAILLSQTAAGGASPAFTMLVDTDTSDLILPLQASCFGNCGIVLEHGPGLAGSIVNPAAETLALPLGQLVIGPVVFQIQIIGSSSAAAGLIAEAFAHSLSVAPPGLQGANAIFKFGGGGPTNAGGWIGNAPTAGGGSPAGWIVGTPAGGEDITIVQCGTPGWGGTFVASLNPGPTTVWGIVFPLGPPFIVLLTAPIPPQGWVTATISIPEDPPGGPELASLTFYSIVVLASPDQRIIAVSEQFSTIVVF